MKVSRVKNRVYNDGRVVAHAEYAVIVNGESVARITRNCGSWFCCERRDDQRFGLPVSPMNLKSFRAVKHWASERFSATDSRR
jgi:hypothetical protein